LGPAGGTGPRGPPGLRYADPVMIMRSLLLRCRSEV